MVNDTTKNKDINIEYIETSLLRPAEYNPRKWDREAEAQLKESIKKYGIVDPLLANSAEQRKNIVIGGLLMRCLVKS